MMSILGSSPAVTIQRVIVYHAGSLHERIEDGRADEFHAFFFKALLIESEIGVEAGTSEIDSQ